MISVEEALDKILSFVPVLQPEEKPVLDCLGQVLAQDIYADFDIPLWDNSAMDGYAVRVLDTCGASKSSPRVIPIVGEVAAGATADKQLEPGTAIRIMTGAPLPEGGPLRIVTLHESYLTDGHYWSKDVAKIHLIDEVDPWHLELHGVEVWNMTHDTYYSLASCTHHRVDVLSESSTYSGVPLYIIVSAMDGADDEHYLFNTTLLSTNYNVTLYDSEENSVTFNCWELTQNRTIIVAGWVDGELLPDEDWPLKLVSKNVLLGNIVKVEMKGWDE